MELSRLFVPARQSVCPKCCLLVPRSATENYALGEGPGALRQTKSEQMRGPLGCPCMNTEASRSEPHADEFG